MSEHRIVFEADPPQVSGSFGWLPDLYEDFVEQGFEGQSRLGPVSEMLNATITFPAMHYPYRPGMARKLGFVEMLQVISGYFDERHLFRAAPSLRYSYGPTHAYGTKVYQQLPKVIEQLRDFPQTRRAIIHIGKPEDGQETEKPCIQSYQFQIRNEFLFTTVYARSWDLVSGLPYDVATANGVAQVVAWCTGTSAIETTVFAANPHVYTEVWDKLKKKWQVQIERRKAPFGTTFYLPQLMHIETYREWAIDQLNDMDDWQDGVPDMIEIWEEAD